MFSIGTVIILVVMKFMLRLTNIDSDIDSEHDSDHDGEKSYPPRASLKTLIAGRMSWRDAGLDGLGA